MKIIEEDKSNLEIKIEVLRQDIKEKEYYSKEIMDENKAIKYELEIMKIKNNPVSLLEESQLKIPVLIKFAKNILKMNMF